MGFLKCSAFMFVFFWTVGFALGGSQERDIQIPRVPPEELEKVKQMKNPLLISGTVIKNGRELFSRSCVACHGPGGKGDGPVARETQMDPKPRDFTNPEFQRIRSDGELFWVLKHGSHDSEMMRMDFFFTDEELWGLISYIRTLGETDH
ncbi:MAG TPA: cytochrome c [Nitrospiria bacterium]|jgi:mono/diheme cytochrome c family protein